MALDGAAVLTTAVVYFFFSVHALFEIAFTTHTHKPKYFNIHGQQLFVHPMIKSSDEILLYICTIT